MALGAIAGSPLASEALLKWLFQVEETRFEHDHMIAMITWIIWSEELSRIWGSS